MMRLKEFLLRRLRDRNGGWLSEWKKDKLSFCVLIFHFSDWMSEKEKQDTYNKLEGDFIVKSKGF